MSEKPEPIPDMSLPPRTDIPPPPPMVIPEMTITDRDDLISNRPPLNVRSTQAPVSQWQLGDRVFAPWEPFFLYVGTIAVLDDSTVVIEFDDGDTGSVLIRQLQALDLHEGMEVYCRRRMGPAYFAGVIEEIEGDDVRVRFSESHDEEWGACGLAQADV